MAISEISGPLGRHAWMVRHDTLKACNLFVADIGEQIFAFLAPPPRKQGIVVSLDLVDHLDCHRLINSWLSELQARSPPGGD
jgi:hypothetical protein